MTSPTQKLKDHSTELRDKLLSKRPATPLPWKLYYKGAGGWQFLHEQFGYLDARSSGMTKEGAHEILRSLNSYLRLVEALRTARDALVKEGHRAGLSAPFVETIDPLLQELSEWSSE